MATKFETKRAITQLVLEISPIYLRLGGYRDRAVNDIKILPQVTPVAMATKFDTK